MDGELLRRWRSGVNGLRGTGIGGGVAAVARRLVGVQGQERGAAELAWQPRSKTVRRMDVAQALDGDGSSAALVRTWAMRGTLHVVAAEDVRWLLALLGPVFVAKGRRRREELALDEAMCARATAVLRDVLAGGEALTRAQVRERLAAEGVPVAGQAFYHLLYRAGLEGVICYGPERAGEETFVLLDAWVGGEEGAEVREALVQRLARRYLSGYGPATAHDFASWSGLGVREARQGLAADGIRPAPGLEAMYVLEEGPEAMGERGALEARLLPAFDSFLLGYASREGVVARAYEREVHPGGGLIRATVLLDGVAVGTWRLSKGNVAVSPFAPLAAEAAEAVAREAAEMEAYVRTS